mmetsp:Transcript_22058/g.61349  ORF Transcript_22058/g.61349 Transcript_22058/m.61349 type:complete len:324 (-) Transcript_22058:804-1775(-)|eukprot:CAMPEP_0172361710 /NCGR_PEP_ID=MMETSP1060-20121228/5498_1 /TAXON_ID=37318 /ORGANISM="Pseudo-nitzschia pungens, Strain cf. cingulata" /LENGTH=323 /DNA_ID=CAMNT_0013084055 /DNA_START=322 /DNA_END=1293 /DNA_ORIENTATION=+
MGRTPSLCGGFLTDKRSMVTFTWSVTTVLTIFAFATALVLTVKVHTHYKYLERYYDGDDWYDSYYNYDNSQDEGNNNNNDNKNYDNSQDEKYRDQVRESYYLLSQMSAKSVTFVAFYTMVLATALSMYGTVAIVGFTSLRGVYIAPCFTIGHNKLRVGIFGGAIVVFANLLLVCAVVLGEVKVEGSNNDAEKEENDNGGGDGEFSEPYEVERIATILAVTFMFLSALYTIFAVLLFLCHAGEEQSIRRIEQGSGVGIGRHVGVGTGHSNTTPLVGLGMGVVDSSVVDRSYDSALTVGVVGGTALGDGARGFITMDNSSQGTAE